MNRFGVAKRRSLRLLAWTVLIFALALVFMASEVKAQEGRVKAAPAAKTVSPANHNQAVALVAKANALRSKGKATDAEYVLQQAVSLDPNWITVYVVRAKVYEDLRNFSNAAENWRSAVMLDPGNASYKRCLARAASQALNWDLAIGAWLDIANQDPHDAEASNQLAAIYFEQDKIEDAIKWNNNSLDINPSDARATLLKGKIALRNRHYQAAIDIFQEVLEMLPSDHPLLGDCTNNLIEAQQGQRKQHWLYAAIAAIPVIAIVVALFIHRYMRKMAEPDEPVLELESATEDSVCRFILQYCRMKFDLPRGFCWSVSLDGRHLSLQMSSLIGDTAGVAQVTINRKAIADWIAARGTAPFIYETELEDVNFQKSFSFLIKELEDININIGVPVVYNGQLYALALLGSSRSARADKVRQRFSAQAETVQMISEKAGMTLERLGRRNRDVIDAKTGMWNRDYYEESLRNIFQGCRTAQIPMSVFMMRMDQVPGVIEHMTEDDRAEVLFRVAQLTYRGISGEMNVTLCHLDNGIFTLIAPERDAKDAETLAKRLKSCFEKTNVLGPDVRTTGCVVYCVAPDDGDDPDMLRSLLSRAFKAAIYEDGNTIQRVDKVELNKPAPEEAPKEELVIRRARRTEGKSSEYQPFGRARILTNADRGDTIDRSNVSNLSNISGNHIVNLGEQKRAELTTKRKPSASTAPSVQAGTAKRFSISSTGNNASSGSLARIPTTHRLSEEAPAAGDNSTAAATPAPVPPQESVYDLDLQYDDDGVEVETQCCSQEVFEELIAYELEQAHAEGTECALVYLRLKNLQDVRSAGRSNYIKLRRELASVMRVFLRDDIDIPGLIDEDDFAVFMTGSDREAAASLAERLNLTSRNLDAGGYFMVPSLGVVLTHGDEISAKQLIMRAQVVTQGEGIHYEEA